MFLIDNGSNDDSLDGARAWSERAPVSVISRPGRWQQVRHYRAAFRQFRIRRDYEWLLIADLDEFWFSLDGRRLPEALADLWNFDVIYGNWRLFGSGGHVSHPDSLRRRLAMRKPGFGSHTETKYFCRTAALRRGRQIGVHKVFGARSHRVISANDLFQLNHYQYQSLEFWRDVKLRRGDVISADRDHSRQREHLESFDKDCTVEDRRLADLLAAEAEAGRRGP